MNKIMPMEFDNAQNISQMIAEVENGSFSRVKEEVKKLTPNELVQMFTTYADLHGIDTAVRKMDILTR